MYLNTVFRYILVRGFKIYFLNTQKYLIKICPTLFITDGSLWVGLAKEDLGSSIQPMWSNGDAYSSTAVQVSVPLPDSYTTMDNPYFILHNNEFQETNFEAYRRVFCQSIYH